MYLAQTPISQSMRQQDVPLSAAASFFYQRTKTISWHYLHFGLSTRCQEQKDIRKWWNCGKRSTLSGSGDVWTPSQGFKLPQEQQSLGSRLNTAHSVTWVSARLLVSVINVHHHGQPHLKKWRFTADFWASTKPAESSRLLQCRQTYLSFKFSINCSIVTSSRRTKSDFPNSRPSNSAITHLKEKLNKPGQVWGHLKGSRSVWEQK